MSKPATPPIKTALHCRNRHRNGYDFIKLIQTSPELTPFVSQNQYGNLSVDFANPDAVKALNKALLFNYYQLTYWDIPDDYLCPPVPGRADYIHYLADLLAEDNHSVIPMGKQIKVLDIGVGANAIYPIVGHAEYCWSFVGSDVNPVAIKVATLITKSNASLKGALQCRLQKTTNAIFSHIIKPKEYYALTMCNPPFHASSEMAESGTRRKLKNLGKRQTSVKQPTLNFGGQHAELWCEGGESAFICRMIDESQDYKTACLWFSSLVSKKETLAIIDKKFKEISGIAEVKVISMAQGQKISRFIAWTYLNKAERQQFLQHLK